ncbi:unnamed protein product [Coregonus sp. 'balchen']|nr:unnamed protein product [Coregonus sp. 'balchen']
MLQLPLMLLLRCPHELSNGCIISAAACLSSSLVYLPALVLKLPGQCELGGHMLLLSPASHASVPKLQPQLQPQPCCHSSTGWAAMLLPRGQIRARLPGSWMISMRMLMLLLLLPAACNLSSPSSQETGQCVCREHLSDKVGSAFYFIALDHYTYEAEDARFGPLPDQWEELLITVMHPSVISTNSRCGNTMPDDDNQMIFLHPGSRAVFCDIHLSLAFSDIWCSPDQCFKAGMDYTVCLSLPLYSALSDVQSPYTLIDSIVPMPHRKNLEIFTGSEGVDVATNGDWDTFQHHCCLENNQSVVKTPSTDISCNFISSASALLHQGAKGLTTSDSSLPERYISALPGSAVALLSSARLRRKSHQLLPISSQSQHRQRNYYLLLPVSFQ